MLKIILFIYFIIQKKNMEPFIADLESKIGADRIISLLKENKTKFACAKCGRIPQYSFISRDCEHNFCQSCINKKPFFKNCPKCHKEIREECLINDEPYTVFSRCYQHYKNHLMNDSEPELNSLSNPELKSIIKCEMESIIKSEIESSTDPELKSIRNPKKSNDFFLQEDCRKLFKDRGGSIDNIKSLLSSGANPNVLNKDGGTLMHEAVDYENVEVLELLLKAGGNVNAYSGDKCTTCLHDVLNEKIPSHSIIKCLLNFGADLKARDPEGSTPLKKMVNNRNLLELLEQHKQLNSLPSPAPPSQVFLLYACNLSQKSMRNLSTFCQTYKIKLAATGKKIRKDVTHIIVEDEVCEPHLEVLMGILFGCYIVKIDWVEESIKKKCILPADNFEIKGTIKYPLSDAPKKSRMNAESLKPRLFSSGQFFIMDGMDQKLNPKVKENLTDLITAGGGKILRRAKSIDEITEKSVFFHTNPEGPLKICSVIVLYNVKPVIVYRMDTVRSFPIHWVYHAIQTFRIEEIEIND